MSMWARDETTKTGLRSVFSDIYKLAQDPSKELVSHAWINNQSTLDLEIPQTMIDVGAAEEIQEMAETYFHLNKSRRFEVRPTTVLDLEPHKHHESVLSASWGGNGLIVRNENSANQLLEGDWAFLHWDLIHESPPRNFEEQRVVMVAKVPER